MSSLVDSIAGLIDSSTESQIAARLGESDAAVSRALLAGTTTVLSGLANKTGDFGLMRHLLALASGRDNSLGTDIDVHSLVRAIVPGPVLGRGGALVTALFGPRSHDVGRAIAAHAGLLTAGSGSSILGFCAPVVLGSLAHRVRDGELSLSSLREQLSAEREDLRAATPAVALEAIDGLPVTRRVERSGTPEPEDEPAAPVSHGKSWFGPAIASLAALALVVALFGRGRGPGAAAADKAANAAVDAARRVVDTAAGTVARDVSSGRIRILPGGATLDIAPSGTESKLLAFIGDSAHRVHEATWIDVDQLRFATGSAEIPAESRQQLENITAILKAFGKVNIQLGGYTDDVGETAANLRLARDRTESVRAALLRSGIPESRITTEAYGESNPVADNSTEAGRASNRRIALRVTAM